MEGHENVARQCKLKPATRWQDGRSSQDNDGNSELKLSSVHLVPATSIGRCTGEAMPQTRNERGLQGPIKNSNPGGAFVIPFR